MINKVFVFFFTCIIMQLFSQQEKSILWLDDINVIKHDSTITLLNFNHAVSNQFFGDNRIYFEKIPTQHEACNIEIIEANYVNILDADLDKVSVDNLSDTVKYKYFVGTERTQNFIFFYLEPFRVVNSIVQKLSSFKIQIHGLESVKKQKKHFVNNSILNTGTWYKLGVSQSGIHKLDSEFLSLMGIDPLSINPHHIRIYGNKSGVLPEGGEVSIDDLKELSISVVGADDGFFNEDDLILFYGESPHVWKYENNEFRHQKNIYSSQTYYFICFDLGDGKRIETIEAENNVFDNPVLSYDSYFFRESDLVNLVSTGRQWFGESFAYESSHSFSIPTNHWQINNILLTARVAARSSLTSTFSINSGSTNLGQIILPNVTLSGEYYKSNIFKQNIQLSPNSSTITFNYNNNGNTAAEAWLDYFTIQGRSDLIYDATGQLLFRDTQSVNSQNPSTNFAISSSESIIRTWDVTDPLNVKNITLTQDGQMFYFQTNTSYLKEFVVFSSTYDDAITPQFVEAVPNQNIHGFNSPSYIIITHPDFINAANRLANYHSMQNGDNVLVATTKQVYNEFSTGSQDISAIRNLVKMFYDRSDSLQMPKNLLLFGDASFDYKNKLPAKSNYVPTYESFISDDIEESYCTDDYFGVLDDDEGLWNEGQIDIWDDHDLLDIGIGRIPVSNSNDADLFVDKVLAYNSFDSRGDWKNKICFVADDTDESWEDILIGDAESLAQTVDNDYPWLNINKIYLDAYPQVLSSGSQRYPDAQNDLRTQIEEGALIVTYFGHGGEIGLASERVLELSDINEFSNINNLPVFITATCEFTRYDDPSRVSAGEYLILNPNGGAIGLYSTSRTVYAGPAGNLVDKLYDYLPDRTRNYTFGESLYKAKNDVGIGNYVRRKFSFFGDPNLQLAHPTLNVSTTSIVTLDSLGQEILLESNLNNDTIKSLSHVRIYGEVVDTNNIVVDFSGDLFVTVFDKKSLLTTLNNDGVLDEPFGYDLQKNIIYKGSTNVSNGYFDFEFIVPKDISYQYGKGKISYYANDNLLGEASGSDKNIDIGGVSESFLSDFKGPDITLFMNDTSFVSGGYTSPSPQLLALFFDESGINTVGTGIGHDLTAVLDDDIINQYTLNNHYTADFNTFKSGTVRYPFYDLPEGEHTVNVKAWDVHNNSSTAQITFFVTSSAELAIKHLLNYPNPASSFTRFVFEHNRSDEELDVTIDIFSINGHLVKTISSTIFTTGFREESLYWNIDPSVDPGIYIYRLAIKSKNDETMSQKTEKLIIVR